MGTGEDIGGLTRRRLGALGLGATAALALSRSAFAGLPRDSGSGPVDVAIIGAGAAGIAAARACIARKASFVMIEARDRIGGRTHSTDTLGTAVDLGAEWLQMVVPNQQSTGTLNPVFDLAVAYSFASDKVARQLDLQPDLYDRAFYRNGRRLPITSDGFLAAAAAQLTAEEAVDAAGRAALQGKAADMSVSQALAKAGLDKEPLINVYKSGLISGHGASPDLLGVQDLWDLSSVGPTPEVQSPFNWKTRYGIGNFIVDFLAKSIPVSLKTPATAIHWRRPGNVAIDTPSGTIQARTVVITVPAAVLAGPGAPKFFPALPAAYRDAFAGLPFGYVEKLFLKFSTPKVFTDVSGPDSENTFCIRLADSTEFRGGEARLWGSNVGSILVGGDLAKELAGQGKRALIAYAKEAVKSIYGGTPARFVVGADTSLWGADPYAMGAYSYAPPGNANLRKVLQQPVSGQLFFAGEATSFFQHSSMPGAWRTGEHAGNLAIAAARKASLVHAGVEEVL